MRLPFFYGWVIVVVTFVTMAIGVNARTAFSLFFPPIVDEFGWERGITAGAFSFGFIVSAAVSPLIGRLMDKYGPRGVMELGVALMAGGLLLAPLTSQPWHLYLTIGVMVGAGSVCLGYSGQSLFLPNWFIRRRGLAMGLAFAGVGIGSVTLLPWVQLMIEQTGWRTACTAMGIMVLVVLAPINLLLRERPEDIGLLPDGDAAPTATSAKPVSNIVDPVWAGTDWTLRRALRTARFWWIALGYFCGLYVWYAVQVHQTKYLLDIGFSANVAVWALGVVSLLGIPGQIWLGHLSDRVGREWIWAVSCLGFAICFAALIALKFYPTLLLVYLMILAQGALGYGLTSIMGAVVLEIFQGKQYGSIFGTIMLAALAGGAAGPWLTGFLHDLTGNYTIAFAIGIARERAVGGRDLAGVAAQGARGCRPNAQGARLNGRPGQADVIPIARCRSPMARRKLSAGVVSGSIRRCRRKPSSIARRMAPVHAGFTDLVLPLFFSVVSTISAISFRRARSRLASSGRRFSARATNRIISMCSSGERPSGSCWLRSMRLQRVDEIRKVLVPGEQIVNAPDRLLDMILEHGDDQLVLALEIRIERPARKAGRGRDGLDAGAADALFLEYPRRRLEQLVAGIVPGRSCSNS